MTSDQRFKKAVRAYAAEKGLPYSQARREFLAGTERLIAHIGTMDPAESIHITIQQESRADLSAPFPFTIDAHGIVVAQPFWRGDPFLLVGFVKDPDTMRVDVHRDAFLDDPDLALGLHPIMANAENNYATFRGAVATVRPRQVLVTPSDAVRGDFAVGTPEGVETASIRVGHLMDHLSDDEIAEMRSAEWSGVAPTLRMLKWAARAGDLKALDLEEHASTWDVEEVSVEGHLDAEQADAWLAARRPALATTPHAD